MYNEKWGNDWLPVTASRKAKWWYSAFHSVNAVVGVGVLRLPFAMSELGWGPGIAVLIVTFVWTLYTIWQLVQMHEAVPRKRFDRCYELGQHAFGEKLGLWIIVPLQLLNLVSVNITYMSIGGMALKGFHNIVSGSSTVSTTPWFILIFASVQFMLSQLRSLNSITAVSLVASVMSVSYCTIAICASLRQGRQENVDYGYKEPRAAGLVFRILTAFGTVAIAFNSNVVALEIQATIPSTPEKPSKKPMWKGVITAYVIIALCYFPVAFVGYWAFGRDVAEVIFNSLMVHAWVEAMATMMLFIHLIGSYQIYAMPVFDIMEAFLIRKLDFSPGFTLSLVCRSIYVAFTMVAAIAFSNLQRHLGFLACVAGIPINYFLPCIMWLTIYKPRRYSLSWFTNWICIILGVMLVAFSTIGGLRKIILSY